MNDRIINRLLPRIDEAFLNADRKKMKRSKNIRLIPDLKHRVGGKTSYAEWAHVIGIFQTIMYQILNKKTGNDILDVGCGTGLLGISSEPFTADNGSYTGIDVMSNDIDFCKKHYTSGNYQFIHFDVINPTYADKQSQVLKPWPIEDDSMDLVTALSVWTHLNEEHALYYFTEIKRVLKKGGKAIITFFYLDEHYTASLKKRTDAEGRFHSSNQNLWIFDKKAYESGEWLTTAWVKNPEDAIAVTETAMKRMLEKSGLTLIETFPGNWKEIPGIYFQDILIFEK